MMLEPNGALRLMPAAYYDSLDHTMMRVWCHMNARYGVPTTELVTWLRDYIGDRKAIEIGAGHGDLCHHLGILGTDNYQQNWPDVKKYYRALGQPTIRYAPWVENIDAHNAIRRYKPAVVVGSWITNWVDPTKPNEPGAGNMYGVKEDALLQAVDCYIMIGNLDIHEKKPIRKLPHEELILPFVRSRSSKPELDRVFIWSRQK